MEEPVPLDYKDDECHEKCRSASQEGSAMKTMLRVRERVYDLNLASHQRLPYNPLVDNALADFFNIKTVREHLVKQNLIGEDGTIYDFRTVRAKQAELDRQERERQHQQVRDNADLEVHIAQLVRQRLEKYKKAHGPEASHVLKPVTFGVDDHVTKMITGQFSPRTATACKAYIDSTQAPSVRPATAPVRPVTAKSRQSGYTVSYELRTKEFRGEGPRPWRPSSLHPDCAQISESKAYMQRPKTAQQANESENPYNFQGRKGNQVSTIERVSAVYGQRPKTARPKTKGVTGPKNNLDNTARSRLVRPKTAKTRSKVGLENVPSAQSNDFVESDTDDFDPLTEEDKLETEKMSFSPTNSTRFDETNTKEQTKDTKISYPLAKDSTTTHTKEKSISKLAESVKNSFKNLHLGKA